MSAKQIVITPKLIELIEAIAARMILRNRRHYLSKNKREDRDLADAIKELDVIIKRGTNRQRRK